MFRTPRTSWNVGDVFNLQNVSTLLQFVKEGSAGFPIPIQPVAGALLKLCEVALVSLLGSRRVVLTMRLLNVGVSGTSGFGRHANRIRRQ